MGLNHFGNLASMDDDAFDVEKFDEIFDLRACCDVDGWSSELDTTLDCCLMPL